LQDIQGGYFSLKNPVYLSQILVLPNYKLRFSSLYPPLGESQSGRDLNLALKKRIVMCYILHSSVRCGGLGAVRRCGKKATSFWNVDFYRNS